jgi:hypothetical protein
MAGKFIRIKPTGVLVMTLTAVQVMLRISESRFSHFAVMVLRASTICSLVIVAAMTELEAANK